MEAGRCQIFRPASTACRYGRRRAATNRRRKRSSLSTLHRVKGVLADTLLSIGPLTGEWTLKAIEVDGRDLADLPLPIEHGKTLSGVRVVLTSRPTVIRGA